MGFAVAALIVCEPAVNGAMTNAMRPYTADTRTLKSKVFLENKGY